MRKDMSKVIVERPRRGRGRVGLKPGRSRVLADDEGEPLRAKGGREPVKTKGIKTKSLNENLNPLKRYLAANVGRPWNKVYSDISEHLKPTSTVQQHVRDHVEDFVATKTRMRAGEVVVTPRWGGERALREDFSLYFVHPRTGLLKANPHYRRWNRRAREQRAAEDAARAKRMRVIDAKTQVHLFDDVWWEVKLAKIGDGREPDVVRTAKLSQMAPEKLYGVYGMRAAEKRILSKAEKKKLGLS